jgi:hypothetical protein
MPWNSTLPILIWAVVFIPLTTWLFVMPVRNKVTVIFWLLAYIAVNLYFLLTVNWVMVNYWLRLLPVLATLVLFFRFLKRWRKQPFMPEKSTGSLVLLFSAVVILAAASFADYHALLSYRLPRGVEGSLLAAYPMRTGLYVVVNAGNGQKGVGMNAHLRDWLGNPKAGMQSMSYAVDFVEMGVRGGLAKPFMSNRYQDYIGYLEPVYAPCPGRVVHLEVDHPDTAPFSDTTSSLLGNRIVIECFDYYVTVANLQHGSTLVQVGDEVNLRMQLARMGVSGDPPVPHLHVHATRGSWDEDGIPVPILFEYNFPVRNMLYIR